MKLELQLGTQRFRVMMDNAVDLSQPVRFDGPQPRFFGVAAATSRPISDGKFVGDTRVGGSCNVNQLSITPHCNSTHTESAAHVSHLAPTIDAVAPLKLVPALVISIDGDANSAESYPVALRDNDLLITAAALRSAMEAHPGSAQAKAMVIRTGARPNTDFDQQGYPFLSVDAAGYLAASAIQHLLIDTPSVDRADDQGRLAAHRVFFGLPAEGVSCGQLPEKTITELIVVPPELSDGVYLLHLGVPPFVTDAAPSRPVLYPIEPC
ncbi:MAG: arylformamidase [Lysobacteraceae bacterium]|nr:MAG: arylformamidase [Xanthomonadaceae bacterium]